MLLKSNLEQRKMSMKAQKSKEISCEGYKYIWDSSTCFLWKCTCAKSSRQHPANVILLSVLFTYIIIGGLSVNASSFLMIYSNNLEYMIQYMIHHVIQTSFQDRANILNLLFFVWRFYIFSCLVDAKLKYPFCIITVLNSLYCYILFK